MPAFEFPPDVAALMRDSGLMPECAPETVSGPVAPAFSTTERSSPNTVFVPPTWYPRLQLGMMYSPTKRGVTLFGPRGSGKTTAVHRLAKDAGVPLVTYQAAAGCTLDDLVGVRDLRNGDTVFTPGPLPRALLDDCWLLIEEANTMHPGVFSKLNTLTDGSGDALALPDGTALPVGPRFRVALAFNEGAQYSGTREVNSALKDRLTPIFAGYMPETTEVAMITARTGVDSNTAFALVKLANDIRAARGSLGFDLSPRALFSILEHVERLSMDWPTAFECAILDLVGDPIDKKPQREAVKRIADMANLPSWVAPTFGAGETAETVQTVQ